MDFFTTYKTQLIYSLIVVLIMIFLFVLTGWVYKWSKRKLQEAGFYSSRRPLTAIKRILNGLWFLLALSGITLTFLGNKGSEIIRSNIKLTGYIALVLVLTIVSASLSNYLFREKIEKKDHHREDTTNLKFLRYVALVGIYFVGLLFILMAFPSLKGVAQTALGGAGILAIIAGIASQEALANLIGGFFIIWFKPFKIGDTVRIDTMQGYITDITLRHTVIRDYENNRIVIPNSIINQARIINFDLQDSEVCERIEIGVSYKSDLKLAQKIMREICESHPNTIDRRTREDIDNGIPLIRTAVVRIDESAIIVRAWAWSSTVDSGFGLRYSVLEQVKERFDREGIEIPYPYRSLIIRKDDNSSETTKN